MDGTKVITISRQELYDRVWTIPMTVLCHDFGGSNVELAKMCDEHDIPRPSSGYWAKKQHGKAAAPTPLPNCDDPELQTIEVHSASFEPAEPAGFDADILDLLKKARGLPAITVPATLNDPHPMVRTARDRLKTAIPDAHGIVSTPWYGDRLLSTSPGMRRMFHAPHLPH